MYIMAAERHKGAPLSIHLIVSVICAVVSDSLETVTSSTDRSEESRPSPLWGNDP